MMIRASNGPIGWLIDRAPMHHNEYSLDPNSSPATIDWLKVTTYVNWPKTSISFFVYKCQRQLMTYNTSYCTPDLYGTISHLIL